MYDHSEKSSVDADLARGLISESRGPVVKARKRARKKCSICGTLGHNAVSHREKKPRQPVPCIRCGGDTGGYGKTGLCLACLAIRQAERRPPRVAAAVPATCHPEREAHIRGMCEACYHREKRKRARARAGWPEWKPALPMPLCACGVAMRARKNKTCGADGCRRKAAVRLCRCGNPCQGQRRTCSDACLEAIGRVHREALGVRSEAKRAKRREQKRTEYKRADKAEVIARLTAEQGGRCAVCSSEGTPRGLALDHCHKTGEPRAMLCVRCNVALGQMLESPGRIRKLLSYSERIAGLGPSTDPVLG